MITILGLIIIVLIFIASLYNIVMWFVNKYISNLEEEYNVEHACFNYYIKCETCKHAKTKGESYNVGGYSVIVPINDGCKLGIEQNYHCKSYEERVK